MITISCEPAPLALQFVCVNLILASIANLSSMQFISLPSSIVTKDSIPNNETKILGDDALRRPSSFHALFP